MEKWYIIQTRPRWEKKVADCLARKGIESYCPVKKVRRKWSDRIKTLEEPVFKSCVFVKITPEQRTDVRLTEGVMNFVHQNGKPVQVRGKAISSFKKTLELIRAEEESPVQAHDVQPGKKRAYQIYLEKFSQGLMAGLERPRLV